MQNKIKNILHYLVIAAGFFALTLTTGCDASKDAGDHLEDAGESVTKAAEEAGENVGDAAEKVKDETQDAVD